ncbi:MAG: twitching motility protein PilT, partial [Chloroflexi bacterium]
MNTEFVVRLIGMAVMAFVGWRVGSIWAGEPPTSYIYCAASSLA